MKESALMQLHNSWPQGLTMGEQVRSVTDWTRRVEMVDHRRWKRAEISLKPDIEFHL